jgi:pSer/pThr/pTyr-binding forkhead associated (FHA) protein
VIQLQVLSGKQAGSDFVVRRFPFSVGRRSDDDLSLSEPGVWEHHLELQFVPHEGFTFEAMSGAPVRLNGEAASSGKLRNGDILEAGAVRIRVWLSRAKQTSTIVRETVVWALVAAACAGQIAAIVWLQNG